MQLPGLPRLEMATPLFIIWIVQQFRSRTCCTLLAAAVQVFVQDAAARSCTPAIYPSDLA
jgi:hypothetical protein